MGWRAGRLWLQVGKQRLRNRLVKALSVTPRTGGPEMEVVVAQAMGMGSRDLKG